MEKNELENILTIGNARLWTSFVNTIAQYNKKCTIKLGKEEQEYIKNKANKIIGYIASMLTEFYETSFSHIDDFEIKKRVQLKLQSFENVVLHQLYKQIENESNRIELHLLGKGYLKQTRDLADTAFFEELNEAAYTYGNALDNTIIRLSK